MSKWVDINFSKEFRKKYKIEKKELVDRMYNTKSNTNHDHKGPFKNRSAEAGGHNVNLLIHWCVGDYDDMEEMHLHQLTLDDRDTVVYADSDDEES